MKMNTQLNTKEEYLEKAKVSYLVQKELMVVALEKLTTKLKNTDQPLSGEERRLFKEQIELINGEVFSKLDSASFEYFDEQAGTAQAAREALIK